MPRQKGKTSDPLAGESGWTLQMDLWGYAVQGEIIEPDACASEKPDESTFRRWDLTIDYLAQCVVDRGRGWERAPYWYCLVHLPWDWRERAFAAHPPAHIDGHDAYCEATSSEAFPGYGPCQCAARIDGPGSAS